MKTDPPAVVSKKPPTSRYAQFTPAQKWAEAIKLHEMAWNLKSAMIRHNHPNWSQEQVDKAVREIFLYATT